MYNGSCFATQSLTVVNKFQVCNYDIFIIWVNFLSVCQFACVLAVQVDNVTLVRCWEAPAHC